MGRDRCSLLVPAPAPFGDAYGPCAEAEEVLVPDSAEKKPMPGPVARDPLERAVRAMR